MKVEARAYASYGTIPSASLTATASGCWRVIHGVRIGRDNSTEFTVAPSSTTKTKTAAISKIKPEPKKSAHGGANITINNNFHSRITIATTENKTNGSS